MAGQHLLLPSLSSLVTLAQAGVHWGGVRKKGLLGMSRGRLEGDYGGVRCGAIRASDREQDIADADVSKPMMWRLMPTPKRTLQPVGDITARRLT